MLEKNRFISTYSNVSSRISEIRKEVYTMALEITSKDLEIGKRKNEENIEKLTILCKKLKSIIEDLTTNLDEIKENIEISIDNTIKCIEIYKICKKLKEEGINIREYYKYQSDLKNFGFAHLYDEQKSILIILRDCFNDLETSIDSLLELIKKDTENYINSID